MDTNTATAAHDAYFTLTGTIGDYDIAGTDTPEELYGPRFAGAVLYQMDGDSEYDDNNYFTPSARCLVAKDVVSIGDALTAAFRTWVTTPDGRRWWDDFESARVCDLLDAIPTLVLWRHGIVPAYLASRTDGDVGYDDALLDIAEVETLLGLDDNATEPV